MRGVLETHFACARCGNELNLEYEHNVKKKDSTNSTDITGALKVENRVYVIPCKFCLKPADDIMRAVEVLQKSGKL